MLSVQEIVLGCVRIKSRSGCPFSPVLFDRRVLVLVPCNPGDVGDDDMYLYVHSYEFKCSGLRDPHE